MSSPPRLHRRSRSTRSEANDLSICLQRTFAEQVVQSSLQGLLAGLCGAGCAGMDLLALAALVTPLRDVEHRTPWPVMEGGWWDIKVPRDLCGPVSPQICRSLATRSISRCLAVTRWFRMLNCSRCSSLLLLVFTTHISPLKPFPIFTDLQQMQHGNPMSAGHGSNGRCPNLLPAWHGDSSGSLYLLQRPDRGAAGSQQHLQTAQPPNASTFCIPLCVLLKLHCQPNQIRSKASKDGACLLSTGDGQCFPF